MTDQDRAAVEKEIDEPECERLRVFLILMFIGGFLGVYTYVLRGGVFCNAQTANFVLMAIAVGNGAWGHALYYLLPMSTYLLGIILSEAVAGPIRRAGGIRWETILIGVEILAVFILGLLPESAPFQIAQITVNFICAMQYNTFRQAQHIPMATTFCTNHLRQTGIAICRLFKSHSDPDARRRLYSHLSMLVAFVLGGTLEAVLAGVFRGQSIWFALVPLAALLADLLCADRKVALGRRVPAADRQNNCLPECTTDAACTGPCFR